jgi:hypothetical protein
MTSSHGQRDQSYRCCNAAYSAQTFPWPWFTSPLIVTENGCSLWRGQASQSPTARPKYRQIPRCSSEKTSLWGFCDGFMKKHGKRKPEEKLM